MYSQPVGTFTYGEPDPVSHTNPPMTTDVRYNSIAIAGIEHYKPSSSSYLLLHILIAAVLGVYNNTEC